MALVSLSSGSPDHEAYSDERGLDTCLKTLYIRLAEGVTTLITNIVILAVVFRR